MRDESVDDLRRLDCNCNDCISLIRDQYKLNQHLESYKGTGWSDNLQFGICIIKRKKT